MRIKRTAGCAIVVAAACATVPPPASAAVSCGDVITQSTELKRDLDCREASSDFGLGIGAGDLTLDLGGHTIRGRATQTGIRVVGQNGVKVTNGSLRRFGDGVFAGGGSDTTISKLVVRGSSEHGIRLNDAARTTVKRNTVAASERNIHVAGVSNETLIAKNRISGGEVGVELLEGHNGTVRANAITGSTDAAIAVGGGGLMLTSAIEANVIERSQGVGIRLQGSPHVVRVSDNEVSESDDYGIEVASANVSAFDINANVLLDNGDAGIWVASLQTGGNFVQNNVVKRSAADGIFIGDTSLRIDLNRAIANKDYGIHSASLNGAGNIALRNGKDPQCMPESICD